MDNPDLATGLSELARARSADDRIWSATGDSAQFRTERNGAVLAAHQAGIPLEQIADELGVLIRDVESMIAAAQTQS